MSIKSDIPDSVRDSLVIAMYYLLFEEEKHWRESGKPRNHIYAHASRVFRWMKKNGIHDLL